MLSTSVWGNAMINYLKYYTYTFIFFCRDFYLNTFNCCTELCNDCDSIAFLESGTITEGTKNVNTKNVNTKNEILELLIENQPTAENNIAVNNEEIKKKVDLDNQIVKNTENSWDIL